MKKLKGIKVVSVLFFLIIFVSFQAFSFSAQSDMFFERLNQLENDSFSPLCVSRYVSKMNAREKIAQLLMTSVHGKSEFDSKSDFNDGIAPGGYLFFKFNCEDSADKIQHFTSSIKNYYRNKGRIPPYLAIDHEGGLVNRLRAIYPDFVSQLDVAQNYDRKQAYQIYLEQANALKSLGFDMNLAPVVEELTDENVDFLVNRSFGSLDEIKEYGSVFLDSHFEANVMPVLKHFPGNTNDDPHYGVPDLKVDKSGFDHMITPFRDVLNRSKLSDQMCGILISHAMVSQVFGKTPSCFSKELVNDLLIEEIGFRGLVISDDVYMAALTKSGYMPESSAVKMILSGIDVIMISGQKFIPILNYLEAEYAKNPVFKVRVDESCEKVIASKVKMGLMLPDTVSSSANYYPAFEKCGFPVFHYYNLEFFN